MSRWIDIAKQKPKHGQKILAKMKHGIISCYWDDDEELGETYLWRDMSFFISHWVSFEDFELMMNPEEQQ